MYEHGLGSQLMKPKVESVQDLVSKVARSQPHHNSHPYTTTQIGLVDSVHSLTILLNTHVHLLIFAMIQSANHAAAGQSQSST